MERRAKPDGADGRSRQNDQEKHKVAAWHFRSELCLISLRMSKFPALRNRKCHQHLT
jgi:hypothetical protein